MEDHSGCEAAWYQAVRPGTREERLENLNRWMPFYSYLAELQRDRPCRLPAAASPVPSLLQQEGFLTPEQTILDIGAGSGDDSLAFSAHCRHVTALEPCKAFVQLLRERVKALGITNVHPIQGAWESFQPDTRFHVTYSSMCPSICNRQELLRMEAITEELCCLVAVRQGSCDRHRHAMLQQLQLKPRGMTTGAEHYIVNLTEMGRKPMVFPLSSKRVTQMTQQQFLERYTRYFQIFGMKREESIPFLQHYFECNAEDGFLREESVLHQALICWKPVRHKKRNDI